MLHSIYIYAGKQGKVLHMKPILDLEGIFSFFIFPLDDALHLSIFHITHTSREGKFIMCFCHFLYPGQGLRCGHTLRRIQGVIRVVVILMIFTEANQGLLK